MKRLKRERLAVTLGRHPDNGKRESEFIFI